MKITSLVENTSLKGLPVEHGLSLHIRLDDGRQVLFDMGQHSLFAGNAAKLGIDLADVDVAILSHGHYDHGGGLATFLGINSHARVYLNRHAFEPHYSLRDDGLRYIGLDAQLQENPRLVFGDDEKVVDEGIILFSGVEDCELKPAGNRLLFGPAPGINDNFVHEQSMIIKEGDKGVLFAGCAHSGIVNIMRRARQVVSCPITHVFSGMHLVKSGLSEEEESRFIGTLAGKLMEHDGCRYFTMHCTGMAQYKKMKSLMGDSINYFSCGETAVI